MSGFPVEGALKVVSMAGTLARRTDWNEWVAAFGRDPVTGAQAAPYC